MPKRLQKHTRGRDLKKAGGFTVDMSIFIYPLFAATIQDNVLVRFIGTSFLINRAGTLATRAHVIESLTSEERAVAGDARTGDFYPVDNLRCHPTMDFAVGHLPRVGACPPALRGVTITGFDVAVMGFSSDQPVGTSITIDPRMFKGNICRTNAGKPVLPRTRSTCEITFPIPAGFSGSPLLDAHRGGVIGMAHGNLESSITTFALTEVSDDGKEFREKVNRVIEFGHVHTLDDLEVFCRDLGVPFFQ